MPRAAARDVVAGVDGLDEAGDVLGRVLQVAVHRHDGGAAGAGEARVHGGMLPEVALEADGPHARVVVVQALERGEGAVGRAVVDEDELEGAAELVEGLHGAAVELLERGRLVEERDDDRELRLRVRLGRPGGLGERIGLGHRHGNRNRWQTGDVAWARGEAIVRRETWRGRPWLGTVVFVVEDSPDLLATYLPEEAPFGFPDGDWPGPTGRHPWHGRGTWEGHGVLMLQRPWESYAVWHFWDGPERLSQAGT